MRRHPPTDITQHPIGRIERPHLVEGRSGHVPRLNDSLNVSRVGKFVQLAPHQWPQIIGTTMPTKIANH